MALSAETSGGSTTQDRPELPLRIAPLIAPIALHPKFAQLLESRKMEYQDHPLLKGFQAYRLSEGIARIGVDIDKFKDVDTQVLIETLIEKVQQRIQDNTRFLDYHMNFGLELDKEFKIEVFEAKETSNLEDVVFLSLTWPMRNGGEVIAAKIRLQLFNSVTDSYQTDGENDEKPKFKDIFKIKAVVKKLVPNGFDVESVARKIVYFRGALVVLAALEIAAHLTPSSEHDRPKFQRPLTLVSALWTWGYGSPLEQEDGDSLFHNPDRDLLQQTSTDKPYSSLKRFVMKVGVPASKIEQILSKEFAAGQDELERLRGILDLVKLMDGVVNKES